MQSVVQWGGQWGGQCVAQWVMQWVMQWGAQVARWVEWLLSSEFPKFLLDHELAFPLLFVLRLVGATTLERLLPARKIAYRSGFVLDIIGYIIVGYLAFPAASYLNSFIAVKPAVPEAILALPTAVLFLLYYIVGDFGAYWMHRVWHLSVFWRVHRWHHSPTSMYFLAGYRASLLQLVLQGLPWIFAYAVLGMAPWWMFLAVAASHAILNDWMHLNVTWRSNWLEWLLVTPRYHHIHHSDKLVLSNSNFGVTFSIWDRLFGTYTDPESVKEALSFGTGEAVPLPRMAVGL